jgi:hypothetical protein
MRGNPLRATRRSKVSLNDAGFTGCRRLNERIVVRRDRRRHDIKDFRAACHLLAAREPGFQSRQRAGPVAIRPSS